MEVEDIISLNTKYTHAWNMYLCSLHNVISDFEYKFAGGEESPYPDANEENWNFDFGIHPPPNPPTRSPHEIIETPGGGGWYVNISNWFLKLPIARYNYIQNVPSYAKPYCTGIFTQWDKAMGDQMAEWEYIRTQNEEFWGSGALDAIPTAGGSSDGWGGWSASPAYGANVGWQYPDVLPPCAQPPPGGERWFEEYRGYAESEWAPTDYTVTYNHRMKASSEIYIGRTYTGYVRFYKTEFAWRKWDENDTRLWRYNSWEIACQDGSGSGVYLSELNEGVVDILSPTSFSEEVRIPITYTITSRDVHGSEDYDETPDIREIKVPLERNIQYDYPVFVLETVSPDFSTN
jgi:hypothetical protein